MCKNCARDQTAFAYLTATRYNPSPAGAGGIVLLARNHKQRAEGLYFFAVRRILQQKANRKIPATFGHGENKPILFILSYPFLRDRRTLRGANHWVAARNAEKPRRTDAVRGGVIANCFLNCAPYEGTQLFCPPYASLVLSRSRKNTHPLTCSICSTTRSTRRSGRLEEEGSKRME